MLICYIMPKVIFMVGAAWMYQINVRKQALRALRKLSSSDAIRLRSKFKKLSENPDRNDIDVVKLKGWPGYRLRSGNWRVIFELNEEQGEINILRIAVRANIYKP